MASGEKTQGGGAIRNPKKNPGIDFYSDFRGNAQVGIDFYSGFRKKNPGIYFYSGFRKKNSWGGAIRNPKESRYRLV